MITPINSIHGFPIPNVRLRNKPLAAVSATNRNAISKGVEQTLANPADTVLIHQLPEGPVNEITSILRRI
ncbi:MAG: hypothetical protein KKE61_03125, partial [Proteobacteria bacterium]|nr:hypothetical protein [Pseudomonadota bacterium]